MGWRHRRKEEKEGVLVCELSLVLKGANVITMDGRKPRAAAVGVCQDRIVSVGSDSEVLRTAGPATKVMDMAGKTVLPGFVDSHVHFMQTGLGMTGVDLRSARSRIDVLTAISAAVAVTPSGELVRGIGYDDSHFGADGPPGMAELTRVAPDHLVWLSRIDGHSCIVNRRAWEALGIPTDTRGVDVDPGGQPTGLLRAEANALARQRIARLISECDRRRAVQACARAAVAAGVTSVCALEGGDLFGDEDAEFLLEHTSDVDVRLTLYYQTADVGRVLERGLKRIGGCLTIDGSFGSRTAALFEPYADDRGNSGCLYFTDDELTEFIVSAHRAGLQIATHVLGDRAIEQILRAYEVALDRFPRPDHRHRLEHFELPTPEQIGRAQRLGLIPSVQPAFMHYWGNPGGMYEQRLGRERARRANPLRTLVEAGLMPAGGSDSDVTPMQPLLGIHAAVNHPVPEQRLNPREAIALFTVNGARATFQEREKGTISPGKLADLVVLEEDPLVVPPHRLKDIRVIMTFIGGRLVYDRDSGPQGTD